MIVEREISRIYNSSDASITEGRCLEGSRGDLTGKEKEHNVKIKQVGDRLYLGHTRNNEETTINRLDKGGMNRDRRGGEGP